MIGTLVAVIAITPIVDLRMKYLDAVDRRLAKWTLKYGLTLEQQHSIKKLEIDFHRFTDVVFGSKNRTPEEIKAHSNQVAAQMNPSAGRLFLLEGDDQKE